MKAAIKKLINRVKRPFLFDIERRTYDGLFLSGQIAAMTVRQMTRIRSLADVEFRVWSQWGEDGIIDWLIERLDISPQAWAFVEFGVESYREANTRFLLSKRNWRGLVIDSNQSNIDFIAADEITVKHDLTAVSAFIDRDNINALIGSKFSGEIGLLSVDIDGNDYWVLERIAAQPIILVCEYNGVFGDIAAVSVPYDPRFFRTRAHFSNLYWGASLPAFRLLMERRGYQFVGTNIVGGNAFFVRSDYAPRLAGALDNVIAHPSRARESRDETGRLTYVSNLARSSVIADLPVVNVETGEIMPLGSVKPLYSSNWEAGMLAGS